MLPIKRSFPFNPLPVDGGISEIDLTPGMVDEGVIISAFYSSNVTVAGTAVRAYSLPVKRVLLTGDGKLLQSWRASDLIRIAQVMEQTPVAAMLAPAGNFTVANYPSLEAHIPLMFAQPGGHIKDPDITGLPTFSYKKLTLRVEWGTATDLFVGAPTAPITFTSAKITQRSYGGLPIKDGAAVARLLPQSVGRYVEVTQAAVAASALELADIGTVSPIRLALIVSELTSTGEPTDTIVDTLTWKEDNTLELVSGVSWKTLRADNAKVFGLTLPPGMAVIDWAEDGDATKIYPANLKSRVKLYGGTLAVAGTIRTATLAIDPPLRV